MKLASTSGASTSKREAELADAVKGMEIMIGEIRTEMQKSSVRGTPALEKLDGRISEISYQLSEATSHTKSRFEGVEGEVTRIGNFIQSNVNSFTNWTFTSQQSPASAVGSPTEHVVAPA